MGGLRGSEQEVRDTGGVGGQSSYPSHPVANPPKALENGFEHRGEAVGGVVGEPCDLGSGAAPFLDVVIYRRS